MDKYPIRLVGEPYVPRELDLDMEPPEWHTPWFEADALDADGHHHRVYWPIPNKTNEWLVGHLLTVDDPDFGDVCDWLHPSLILCYVVSRLILPNILPPIPCKFPSTFRPFRSAPHPCGAERSTRPGASSEAPGFLFFYGCGKYPAARIASVEIATLASITSSHPASPCAATASRASVGQ